MTVGEARRVLPPERGQSGTGGPECRLHVVLAADERGHAGVEQSVLQIPEVVPAQGRVVDEVPGAPTVGRVHPLHVPCPSGTAGAEVSQEGIEFAGQVGVHPPSLAVGGPSGRPGTEVERRIHLPDTPWG